MAGTHLLCMYQAISKVKAREGRYVTGRSFCFVKVPGQVLLNIIRHLLRSHLVGEKR